MGSKTGWHQSASEQTHGAVAGGAGGGVVEGVVGAVVGAVVGEVGTSSRLKKNTAEEAGCSPARATTSSSSGGRITPRTRMAACGEYQKTDVR